MSNRINDFADYPEELLNIIPVYEGMAYHGDCMLDIIKLDSIIAKLNPAYNPSTTSYKNIQGVSIKKAIELIYGKAGLDLVELLLKP